VVFEEIRVREFFPLSLLYSVDNSDHAYRVVRNAHFMFALLGLIFPLMLISKPGFLSEFGISGYIVAFVYSCVFWSSLFALRGLLAAKQCAERDVTALYRSFGVAAFAALALGSGLASNAISETQQDAAALQMIFFAASAVLANLLAFYLLLRRLSRRCRQALLDSPIQTSK
jgi:hypothetical protein